MRYAIFQWMVDALRLSPGVILLFFLASACDPVDDEAGGGTLDSGATDSSSSVECAGDDDCEGLCRDGVCDAPTHDDGKKNIDETDVDCGGATAPKCLVHETCTTNSDCKLGYCSTNACAVPATDDGIRNGTETDVDCGGAEQEEGGIVVSPPRCDVTKMCDADADCASRVCSDLKRCVEAPSCRRLRGGATCGSGETGAQGAAHESCCKTLPVDGMTMSHDGVDKQVYVDKYEITAGRVRAWIEAIKAQYNGVPNIRAWVVARVETDPLVATQLGDKTQYLPTMNDGEAASFPGPNGTTVNIDIGLLNQLGPTSYYRGVAEVNSRSGCGMYADAYGHRTYWFDDAERAYFGEIARPPQTSKDLLDEKAMNCLTPVMFAAFCAWDGGYLVTREAIHAAYGPANWPWGETPKPTEDPLKRSNVNNNILSLSPANPPRYLFPVVDYATFSQDFTPLIAAPGRFPLDVSAVRPEADSWMDLGANLIEVVANGADIVGYVGASWEVHEFGRAAGNKLVVYDKYGKTGARCMRLR